MRCGSLSSVRGIPLASDGGRNPASASALILALALAPATAPAHEFWVEPSRFSLEPGERIGVRLCVGDGFEGWSLPRDPRRIEKFVAEGATGAVPVVGLEGSDPAGAVRLVAPGGYIVTYRSNRAFTVVPSADFEQYVSEKGLEKAEARRGKRSAGRGGVREAYSRHSKALVNVGKPGTAAFDRALGLRLELVAESALSRADADTPRSFRLLHEGEPLVGALVTATRPGTADPDQRVRTDSGGRAQLTLHAPGMWRIAAVHMLAAPDNVAADWESLWASLTFELPSPGGAGRAAGTECSNKFVATTAQTRP